MDLNEFESQTRSTLEQTLNQLQTATLMIAQLEIQLSEAGRTIQTLSRQIEEFIAQQRQSPNGR
jgi:septal ring factor EnvC (AmiA/AmiB activator)